MQFDDDDEFELTPEMEAELEESIAQADRGEGVPLEQVLRDLREMCEQEMRRRSQS